MRRCYQGVGRGRFGLAATGRNVIRVKEESPGRTEYQKAMRRAARGAYGRGVTVTLLVLAALLVPPARGRAASLPSGFSDSHVATVTQPTAIAFTPDGRMLVASKLGALRVIAGGQLLGTPAVDLTQKICSNSERGLLGVAVDPSFTTNQFIYLYYTFKKFTGCPTNNAKVPVNRVSRFVLPQANVISPDTEVILVDNILSYGGYHNAGDLNFGKDGKLYISSGDGGCDFAGDSGCAEHNDAARGKNVLIGKILRVNRDGTIPADNPFTGALSARCGITGSTAPGTTCREIYATGLRNPFRFAMDPNASGTRLYINDVGQNLWEEIDLGQSGADYGWNVREGHCATNSNTNCGPNPPGMTGPIFDYHHNTGCSAITGGAFVPTGIGWPADFAGKYLFGDYVCGTIFTLDSSGPGFVMTPFATGLGVGSTVHMEFGPPGTQSGLYYATYADGGEIRKISYSGTPVAEMSADPTTGEAPLDVAFDGSGSADPQGQPLTYLWDFGDGVTDTTTAATTNHTYTTNGTFTASLRVEDVEDLVSSPDTAQIIVGNTAPTPVISSPAEGSKFFVGQTLTLSGSADDAQDGPLPASSLTWTVQRFHLNHTHPWVGPVNGNNISFTAPAPEDLAAVQNSYLIVILTATDSAGSSSTVVRTVQPSKITLTMRTNPLGLYVKVAGSSVKANPGYVTSWSGWTVELEAVSPQGGYVFFSWSDGGARVHSITPYVSATYTAKYVKVLV